MKIILSRKGFDSASGGVASPISPANELLSLPIPDPHSPVRYRQLKGHRPSVSSWVASLTRGRLGGADRVHLDPDLSPEHLSRQSEWRPAFGQAGAALGHLDGQSVGVGDLFLFFGWFRQVDRISGGWRYRPGAPDVHVLYGWLAVGDVWRAPAPVPAAVRQHVHVQRSFRGANAIYMAADSWQADRGQVLPGAGLWKHHQPSLVLTDGSRRSQWKLPEWFHPEGRASCLSYHHRPERWTRDTDCCRLELAARGQEFVLDCDHYPEAPEWAARLIALSQDG